MSKFGVRGDQRVALFIDGPSFYATTRSLGFEVDYRKLLAHFEEECVLYRAFYFTSMAIDGEEFSPVKPLVDWLGYNGYRIITKPLKEYTDATGRRRVKGGVQVEMAVEMLRAAQFCDHIVLFSGEGDLKYVVDAVQQLGVRVTVVSTTAQDVTAIADELRRQVDRFVDLETVKPLIFKRDVVSAPQAQSSSPANGPIMERRPPSVGIQRRA